MQRNDFIKALLGSASLIAMDGFSSIANSFSSMNIPLDNTGRYATFGAIHLNITNLDNSIGFYTELVGMKLRTRSEKSAELGTESKTLLVLHQSAKSRFKKGYSGLYHFAIHAPNAREFANMVKRVIDKKYPSSPVDHTMSKSLYLDDPDDINVEFTLETPERFKRVVTEHGLGIEDMDGNIRSASAQLDLNEVLSHADNSKPNNIIDKDTYLGHIHLYANNVEESNSFYQKIGFESFNFLPQFMYAVVGAGGSYKHRIAMNSWHGQNRPLAPIESAGMRHFHIIFDSKERLEMAIMNAPDFSKKDGEYWLIDPTGNKFCLTYL